MGVRGGDDDLIGVLDAPGVDDPNDILGAKSDYDVLGDVLGAVLQQNPAFRQLLAKRSAMHRPVGKPVAPNKIEAGLTTEKIDALLENAPSLDKYVTKQVPLPNGPMWQKQPLQKARDWDIPLGPAYGKAGSVQTLTVQPTCLFRGEKLIATDSAPQPGTGTRITGLFVGSKAQLPNAPGTLTSFFGHNALGSGMKMDTCQPALTIAMTVSFIIACTFSACIFGKAVL